MIHSCAMYIFDYKNEKKKHTHAQLHLFSLIKNMPNGRKRAERAALLTSDLLHHPPVGPLTLDQLRSIRFTHIRIHPTFANASRMTVFEVYFAIKYGLMALSRLPPIRVFEYEGNL